MNTLVTIVEEEFKEIEEDSAASHSYESSPVQ